MANDQDTHGRNWLAAGRWNLSTKKFSMQLRHTSGEIGFAKHDRHVPARRRLRHHAHGEPFERTDDARGNARITSEIVADGTQDCEPSLDVHLGELPQRSND